MNPAAFGALPSPCSLGTTGNYGPDRITFGTYDAVNRLAKVTSAYGVSGLARDDVTYTYSVNGKVSSIADAKGNLTSSVYDGFDRLYEVCFPNATACPNAGSDYERYGYDAYGNMTSKRLRDGNSINYTYDALNRLSAKTPPSGESAVTYTYDNIGHLKTIAGATTLSYAFDALGRMTSETQPFGSLAYQYDLSGRRTRLTWQDGVYITYDYLATGEMTAIHENGGTVLASFNYDDLGRRTGRTLANGTVTGYNYDNVSRLTFQALYGPSSATNVTLSNYSPGGELGARANSNDAFAWTQGSNVNRAYTINALNQFATVAGATQGYDARGNLTSSGGITYAYSSENHLKTVSGGYVLAYDPIGRLDEYDVPAATHFVYDGGMISEELNASGTVLRRYAFGPAGDEPIVWYEGSGTATKRYLDQDERGSVTRITDGSGAAITVNSYDEYGIPGSGNQGRFGYTGQAWMPEIGLAYSKARMYSPTFGRFMQTDPIGYGDGPNWYNYVGGDPVNATDSSGLDGDDGGDGGGIVVTGPSLGGVAGASGGGSGPNLTGRVGGPSASAEAIVVIARSALSTVKLTGLDPSGCIACTAIDYIAQDGSIVVQAIYRNYSPSFGGLYGSSSQQADGRCTGPRANYSYGLSGTLAALFGVSGGLSANISFPTTLGLNPLKGIQISVSAQAGYLIGYGAYGGIGEQHSFGLSGSATAAGGSTGSAYVAEADAGAGASVGISAQGSRPIGSGISGGVGGKLGGGAGVFLGAGKVKTATFAFAPIGC